MKIIVADDHALLRQGLRDILGQLDPDVVVIEADDADSTLNRLGEHQDADLAIIDLRMPGMAGVDSLPKYRTAAPTVPLVILSASEDPADMRGALDHGVAGFIPKNESPAVIMNALRLILSGGVYVPPALINVTSGMQPPVRRVEQDLTPRQFEVLQKLMLGLSNKEIARELGLSEATVKAHLTAIFRALNIANRAQAMRAMQQRQIFRTD